MKNYLLIVLLSCIAISCGSGYFVVLQQALFNGEEICEKQVDQGSNWELPIIVKEPNEKDF